MRSSFSKYSNYTAYEIKKLNVNDIGKLINPYFYQQKPIVKCNNSIIGTINVMIP